MYKVIKFPPGFRGHTVYKCYEGGLNPQNSS